MFTGTPFRHTQRPAAITPVNIDGCTPATRCAGRFCRRERRRRHVVVHHQVGSRARRERPDRHAEDLGCERLSALEQRGGRIRAPQPELLPLPEVREAQLGQHIGRPAVGAERRPVAEPLDRRVPDGVVHVRPRVVDEPGPRLRDARDVALRQVHAVRQYCPLVEQAVPLDPVDDAAPVRPPGAAFVILRLRGVDVDAGAVVSRQVPESGQARIVQRE